MAANVTLHKEGRVLDTAIVEDMPRPNEWYDLFNCPEIASGCIPCTGHEWRHSMATYAITDSPHETAKNREVAINDLCDLLQQNAKEMGGSPSDWKVIVLKDWWMSETFPRGENRAFIDCTYAIVPKDAK